jgi:PAS domain S-box-containing protein
MASIFVTGANGFIGRHLVEAAECMIVIVRPDHAIAYFSPFAERLTGYSSAEVRSRDYLALMYVGRPSWCTCPHG